MISDFLPAIFLGIILSFTIGPVFFTILEVSVSKGFKAAVFFNIGVVFSEFENSDSFSDSEKAALRIAMNAAQTPNLISDEDFNDFKKYYDENQQMEILAIVSLFGFLNRWNSSLMTEVESIPSSRMKELE